MRLSHSRIDVFNKCKRWFYYQYIKKISVPSDDRHARRGNVFHKCAQYIVNSNPSIEEIKTFFANKWHEYKLEDFNEHKDETYTMVINFYNCKPLLTSTELEVLLPTPEFVGYIDGVNTNEDIVIDYKTSGWYNGISETEYKNQMGRYAYLYFRKFGRLPKKVIVYWVKFFPFKTVEYIFTEEDIFKYEQEIFAVDKFVEENKDNINVFTCCKDEGKECNIFCPYENECSNKMTFVLHLTGSYIRIEGEISDLLDRGLEKKFSYELKNAHWIKKNYPQANTTVRLWKRNKQLLPSGFLSGLKKTLSDYADYAHKNLELIIIDERVFDDTNIQMPASFVNGNTLREYQQQASNVFLDSKVGLLELGTGAGKTEIAIEIIRKLGIKTLFIVDKKELLRQTKERIEQYLGIEVGQIGDNEQDIKPITVATIQTLIKRRQELIEYLGQVRFAIFDECVNKSTKIMMSNGEQIRIDKLYEDNDIIEVLSFNEEKQVFEKKKILRKIKQPMNDNWWNIIVKDELGNHYKLIVTSNHKIWTSKGYKRVSELTVNDILKVNLQPICYNHSARILSVKKSRKKSNSFRYNLEIEDNHNYIANRILVSNCHKVAAKSYTKISTYLTNAEYRLGLTGTSFRDDGNDMLITAVTGPIVYDLSSKVLIQNGWLVKPLVLFYSKFMEPDAVNRAEENSKTGTINETDKYPLFYGNFISNNESRNSLIIRLCNTHQTDKVLILVKLVEHGKLLETLIPNSKYLWGETSTEERKDIFEKFKGGDIKVLISTISIMSEGIDLPHLTIVINAAANKGNVKTVQIIGRILRKLEGKSGAKYIDFIDESRFFKYASYARKRILQKEGHDVEVEEINDFL